MYNLLITVLLIASFFMCLSSYWMGFRHGKQLNKDNIPKINLNPVKPIVEAVERVSESKNTAKLEEELVDVMSYSKETALHHVKKEALKL